MRLNGRLWFLVVPVALFIFSLSSTRSEGALTTPPFPEALNRPAVDEAKEENAPGYSCYTDQLQAPQENSPERGAVKTGRQKDFRDRSIKERIRAIAEDMAEEDEVSIRNAFVHRPEDLDDLMVPLEFKDAVDHYITYFTTRKRDMFASWLRRAKRYTPLLKRILREYDLPEDLVYLAMIESGFNPKAYSPMAACGPWQFISATGQRYGLRIDRWVDERRDFEKAIVAAARYLKDLFEQFDCWYLAASGYNAGEGRVQAAIRRHNTSNYWELYRYNTLPRETREYIPQLIAAAAISQNPEKYGFTDIDESLPLEYKKRKVPGGTPLYLVAEASASGLAEIRALNPELMTKITPPGEKRYTVKLPGDTSLERFDETLKARLPGKRVVGTVRLASLRQASLNKALKRYGATKTDLELVNPARAGAPSSRRPVYIPLFERTPGAEGETTATTFTDTGTASRGGEKKRAIKKGNTRRNYRKGALSIAAHKKTKSSVRFQKTAQARRVSLNLRSKKTRQTKTLWAKKQKPAYHAAPVRKQHRQRLRSQ